MCDFSCLLFIFHLQIDRMKNIDADEDIQMRKLKITIKLTLSKCNKH